MRINLASRHIAGWIWNAPRLCKNPRKQPVASMRFAFSLNSVRFLMPRFQNFRATPAGDLRYIDITCDVLMNSCSPFAIRQVSCTVRSYFFPGRALLICTMTVTSPAGPPGSFRTTNKMHAAAVLGRHQQVKHGFSLPLNIVFPVPCPQLQRGKHPVQVRGRRAISSASNFARETDLLPAKREKNIAIVGNRQPMSRRGLSIRGSFCGCSSTNSHGAKHAELRPTPRSALPSQPDAQTGPASLH